MLLSISLILLGGMLAGRICQKLRLPGLLGMIITGILLGPYVFNMIDSSILNISAEIRKIALIIILTRAGLTLNLNDLKKAGRPAVLMCFLPALFEILGMTILAPLFFDISHLDAAIIGTVVGAVSPAVIVPKMIRLIEDGYGSDKAIPQMILAGASVDDVFVIVLFSIFTEFARGEQISAASFIAIPESIAGGIVIGVFIGRLLLKLFEKADIHNTEKAVVILGISFILVTIEDSIHSVLTFSALVAVMFIGVVMQKGKNELSLHLSSKFNNLWIGAEIFLFVLVGSTVDINYVTTAAVPAVFLILIVLCFRILGVFICTLSTPLSFYERLFCAFAYIPKATVQAAIGGIPLSMGLSCGNTALTVAVASILITAPLGAFLIELTYKYYLHKS